MDNDLILDIMFWGSIILSLPLLFLATMSLGKHIADLMYQREAKLNGVRWIQSWMSLRIHGNRVAFAIVFITTSIMGVFDVDPYYRTLVGRPAFLIVLFLFTQSAILDWFAEHKQLRILLQYEKVNNLPSIRWNLHQLNDRLQYLYGLIEMLKQRRDVPSEEIEQVQDEIKTIIRLIQQDIRAMDPSYKDSYKLVEQHVDTKD